MSTPTNQEQVLSDTNTVKNWLSKVIIDYRNQKQTTDSDNKLQASLTRDYYQYKLMDITSEYDTLTNEQFDAYWKTKFQTQYVGKSGFFNWTQDSGPIEILKCNYVKQNTDTSMTFQVVTKDLKWQTTNNMDITVVSYKDTILIGDVKHQD
jgi:hypothetical protein